MLKTLSLWSWDDTGFQYSSHLRVLRRNQSLVQREQHTELRCRERLLLASGTSGSAREPQTDKKPVSVGHQLLLARMAEGALWWAAGRQSQEGRKEPTCSPLRYGPAEWAAGAAAANRTGQRALLPQENTRSNAQERKTAPPACSANTTPS